MKVNFTIDKVVLLEEYSNWQLTKVRMYIVSEGDNAHNFPIDWDKIWMARESLVGKPVLCKYNRYTKSFEGHEPDEIPVGVFLNLEEIYEQTRDDKRWLVADAYIWKMYAPEVVQVLQDDPDHSTNISMEITVIEPEELKAGKNIDLFVFNGVTLIGVDPAVENAKAEVLRFSNIVNFTKDILQDKYSHIDFTIPNNIKFNIRHALSGRFNKPLSFLFYSNYLLNNDVIDKDKIDEILELFEKNKHNEILGGSDCKSWCEDLKIKMSQAEVTTIKEDDKMVFNKVEFAAQFSLTANDIWARFSQAVCSKKVKCEDSEHEYPMYYMVDYDAEYVYCALESDWNCKVAMSYSIDGENVNIDFDGAKRARTVTHWEILADEAEFAEDEVFTCVMDSMKAKMSNDENIDIAAQQAQLENETEVAEEVVEEAKEDEPESEPKLFTTELEAEYQAMATELASLREFKAEVDRKDTEKQEQEKMAKIEYALQEVVEYVPDEKINELRDNVKNFESLDAWMNHVKAEAFTFAKNAKKDEKPKHVNAQFAKNDNDKDNKKSNSVWNRI